MNTFDYVSRDDAFSLRELVCRYGSLAGKNKVLAAAYAQYVLTQGDPQMGSIGLTEEQARCFSSAYNNKSRKFGLSWIEGLTAHRLNTCPMCGGLGGKTVEHYLPKGPYPEFSVFSYNLFPSCESCNSTRGSRHKKGVAYKLLHPFFDVDILSNVVLVTELDLRVGGAGFNLVFNESAFTDVEIRRVRFHIDMCLDVKAFEGVSRSYLDECSVRARMSNTYQNFNSSLRTEVQILEGTSSGNSWRAALFRGLLSMSKSEVEAAISVAFR
ncbi:HNH endonuclease family protein [Pseudomonas simiae]|jgi:hypothetical protein|uniref:hypothetical protein n=1 Tax=Pseudomonas simiae TaxID=321846 RepID=UPI000A3E5723|nr:hypothetical protein [Pseudomonas simiae]NVH63587.1 hypothetical protein [Pseudomonas simiae]WLG71600.1 hypothetical protein PSH60_15610 [Pseudomonas simiae]